MITGIEGIFESRSWIQFGVLIVLFAVVLLVIRLLIFVFDNLSHQSVVTSRLRSVLQFILDHIEPFILLFLLGYFITIDFILHTLIVVLLGIGGFRQIRDYITGQALKYNGSLAHGSNISIGNINGEVDDLLRLGVQIKSKDATYFYNYAKLYDEGFTVHAKDAFGGYSPLVVSQRGDVLSVDKVKSIIMHSPYSDDFNPIRLDEFNEQANRVKLNVHLRKAIHLEDLKALLSSKGYDCE